MKVRVALLVFAILLISAVGSQAGQTATVTAGAVNGTVTDDSDAVLPGAAVTISGPALMGVVPTTPETEGASRFQNLAPGNYRLVYEFQASGPPFGKAFRSPLVSQRQ